MTMTFSKTAGAAPAKISPENYRYLCDEIYRESGIVLDDSKHYLVEARLAPLARKEGLETLDSLCNLIRAASGRALKEKVVEAMTTNETLFFRDVKPFEALKQVVIPELVERVSGRRTLRVWSAACSTGQEAYSIAMLFTEMRIPGWALEILGTDLNEEVLAKARGGRYLQLEVNRGLPATMLVKYFQRDETDWVVKPEIRKLTRWEKFNLKSDMSRLGPFDIVLCRNVLIYFDQRTKARILRAIRGALAPGGYLFLGSSETTLNLDQGYARRQVGPGIAYQNPVAS